MASNFVIGLLLGLGFGGWVYSKALHANGGLIKRALIVGVVAGLVACIVLATLLGIVFHHS